MQRGYRFKADELTEYVVWDKPVGWEADIYKEQLKMTREEARQRVLKLVPGYQINKYNCEEYIDVLEALGLLKFEEEKKPKYINIEHCGLNCLVAVNDLIEALRRIDIICVEKEK